MPNDGISCKHKDWLGFLNHIKDTGFTHCELCIYDMEPGSILFQPEYLGQIKKLSNQHHITLSIHTLDGINLAEKIPRLRRGSIDILKDTVEIAGHLEAEWVTVHLGSAGFSGDERQKKEQRIDYAIDAIQQIEPKLSVYGTKLAIENLRGYSNLQGKCKIGTETGEFEYIFKKLNSGNVGMLFDLGHSNIYERSSAYINDFMIKMEEHIIAAHIHFNDGKEDSHSALPTYPEKVESCLPALKKLFDRNIPFVYESYSLAENIASRDFLYSKLAIM